jgi:TatD DNase family protein
VVHCKHSPFDVYIGRASKGMPKSCTSADWGNPFAMRDQSDRERERVISEYRAWLMNQPELVNKAKSELRGKILACWCAPKDCHGHVLVEIANEEATSHDAVVSARDVAVVAPSTAMSSAAHVTNTIWSGKKFSWGESSTSSKDPTDPSIIAKKTEDEKPISSELVAAPASDAALPSYLVDIGINITNRDLKPVWEEVVQRAISANVGVILLTGTSISCSKESIRIARKWETDHGTRVLRCTAGVHPHDAKSYTHRSGEEIRNMLQDPLVVAVGECGLDFNRNFSTREEQIRGFRDQIEIACDLRKPMFVHERDAHADLLRILDSYLDRLPPVVIHCFTGTLPEAQAYISRGFHIGFTGTICKRERGAHLRELIPHIPLNKIMIETDAPFMGFVKGRRHSEPSDVSGVAAEIARCYQIPLEVVIGTTTLNAIKFFKL